jgi:hypothetical protein
MEVINWLLAVPIVIGLIVSSLCLNHWIQSNPVPVPKQVDPPKPLPIQAPPSKPKPKEEPPQQKTIDELIAERRCESFDKTIKTKKTPTYDVDIWSELDEVMMQNVIENTDYLYHLHS